MVRKANYKYKKKKQNLKIKLNISQGVGLGLKLSMETCDFLCVHGEINTEEMSLWGPEINDTTIAVSTYACIAWFPNTTHCWKESGLLSSIWFQGKGRKATDMLSFRKEKCTQWMIETV